MKNQIQGSFYPNPTERYLMSNEKKVPKARSVLAQWIWINKKNAAGPHKNKRKEAQRKICRGKVKESDCQ